MLLSPVLLPTVPLGQGVGAELPMLQKAETMQVSQDVALSAPWYVPAGHWMGSDALPTQYPPRLQGRGLVVPPMHQLPSGQPKHASADALRNVPGSQDAGIGTTLPAGQSKPALHSMHAVEPAAFWYVP